MSILRRYMEIFPSTHLTTLLKGYFNYMEIPLEETEEESSSSLIDNLDSDPVSTILVRLRPLHHLGNCFMFCLGCILVYINIHLKSPYRLRSVSHGGRFRERYQHRRTRSSSYDQNGK